MKRIDTPEGRAMRRFTTALLLESRSATTLESLELKMSSVLADWMPELVRVKVNRRSVQRAYCFHLFQNASFSLARSIKDLEPYFLQCEAAGYDYGHQRLQVYRLWCALLLTENRRDDAAGCAAEALRQTKYDLKHKQGDFEDAVESAERLLADCAAK